MRGRPFGVLCPLHYEARGGSSSCCAVRGVASRVFGISKFRRRFRGVWALVHRRGLLCDTRQWNGISYRRKGLDGPDRLPQGRGGVPSSSWHHRRPGLWLCGGPALCAAFLRGGDEGLPVVAHQRVKYYSAEENLSSAPEVGEGDTPRRKKKPGKGLPTSIAKPAPKPKRATAASLAASLESLMMAIPTLASQMMQALQDRQVKFEEKLAAAPMTTRSQLTQPLSSLLQTPPRPSFEQVAKHMTPPPRTSASPALGLLAPLAEQPAVVKELEEEKLPIALGDQSSLARAVLAQSQALTTLVSQIASASSDPMTELSGTGTSTGTRGAQGRARLQAELAQHKGSFFASVLQSMARRMAPTSSTDLTPQEMMNRGICGTKYIERFGGYGRMREWGQLQFQVMTALDYLMDDNIGAAKDTVALLAVTLEQGVLDNGRLEIASLLCLQEDVPAGGIRSSPDWSNFPEQSFCPSCRSTLGHLCTCIPEGDGRDCIEMPGVCRGRSASFCSILKRSRAQAKAKGHSKEERKVKGINFSRRRCGLIVSGHLGAPDPEVEHGVDGFPKGLVSNPLKQTISFRTWAICLPRWILSSRTTLGWQLFRSFTARWRRMSAPTATLPLPVPYPGCFGGSGGGPRLSQKRLSCLAQQRALHVAVIIVNKLYLGRYASLEELERCWQRKRLSRLRAFYVACGSYRSTGSSRSRSSRRALLSGHQFKRPLARGSRSRSSTTMSDVVQWPGQQDQ